MKAALQQRFGQNRQRPAASPAREERRCLVAGLCKPKEAMIRFVLDPQGRVVPDLAGRLPGRGLWVSAERAALDEAVRKNLFSKAAKRKVAVPADLAELTLSLLAQRCLQTLGLARSAGAVVMHEAAVLEAIAAGKIGLVLLAQDAGEDIQKKLSRFPSVFTGFARAALSEALGKTNLVAAGLVRDHTLTSRLHQELTRWQGLSGMGRLTESSEKS